MTLPMLQQLAEKADAFEKWKTEKVITWCSNCGNFGIFNALMRAMALEDLTMRDVALCFDVGCNGNGSDKINGYTIHGLHGRVTSLAAGAHVANPNMQVIAFAGDGATFSEGPGHLIHSIRNNYKVVFIHHNNENYGLTTGQPSSITRKGTKLNSAPTGVTAEPLNHLDLVLSLKPSFVARAYSADVDHLTEIIQKALEHDGFAFIDVLQACPTYNRETPDEWYAQRVHKVEEDPNYDNSDIWAARKIIQDLDERIACGILYHNPDMPSFMKLQQNREGITSAPVDEVKHYDVSELY